MELEKAGVIVFKDASANKGGVTSSSLEVLAALVLTDAEFEAHMTVAETEHAVVRAHCFRCFIIVQCACALPRAGVMPMSPRVGARVLQGVRA